MFIDADRLLKDRPSWCLIENEGALFRGPGRGNPQEVWGAGGWKPYAGAERERDVAWGDQIDVEAALRLIAG